jgi:hypothetical protein
MAATGRMISTSVLLNCMVDDRAVADVAAEPQVAA